MGGSQHVNNYPWRPSPLYRNEESEIKQLQADRWLNVATGSPEENSLCVCGV